LELMMRVIVTALALSAVSFAAGVAGDLSIAAPTPPSAVVPLPPISADAIRAHALPPLRHAGASARAMVNRRERAAPTLEPTAPLSPSAVSVEISPNMAQKVGDLIRA
jgi:hypothetical protein